MNIVPVITDDEAYICDLFYSDLIASTQVYDPTIPKMDPNFHYFKLKRQNPQICLLLAYNKETPIGFLYGYPYGSIHHQIGLLDALYIEPNYQHQGVGTLLINTFQNFCLNHGLKEIELNVDYHNSKAISLYNEKGFQVKALTMRYQIPNIKK